MALAEYFSKNLLAISQVLQGGTGEQFQNILNNSIVGIAFDNNIKKHEGKATLDLTVRLVSRLYPKIKFIDLGSGVPKIKSDLQNLAMAINSKIEFSEEDPTVLIVIGSTNVERKITAGPIYFIGSDNWIAKYSTENPVGVGESTNPLAAGISACIGTSNVFRYVFSDFLPTPEFDENFSLSLITLNSDEINVEFKTKQIDLGNFQLAGFGAIGNGFVWALSNSPFLKGVITVIEPETIEASNLQRYVLAEEKHIEKSKLEIAKEVLLNSKMEVNYVTSNWAGYLNETQNWKNEIAVIAIDNAKDRIGIQASLPKQIINSYTENNLIGILRHNDFINDACLVCNYMPSQERPSFAYEVCENLGIEKLGIPEMEKVIGGYLYSNKGADDQLLDWIAAGNSIEISKLEKFKGIPVNDFYSKIVCGGILMNLKNEEDTITSIEAPLAFQSAMAGILELSELIIQKVGLRKNSFPNKTQFYPLLAVNPGVNPYNHSFPKDNTGRCICADQDFIDSYKTKWN